jgi:DNA-directed RNA polymerase specialized sigma24 family protein
VPTTTLTSLIERIAVGDRTALRLLYGELRETAGVQVGRTLSRNEDVHAVVDATFVEVWWLSRFHTANETDVPAWVNGIARRRAAERFRAMSQGSDARMHDDVSRVALEGLLGLRRDSSRGG